MEHRSQLLPKNKSKRKPFFRIHSPPLHSMLLVFLLSCGIPFMDALHAHSTRSPSSLSSPSKHFASAFDRVSIVLPVKGKRFRNGAASRLVVCDVSPSNDDDDNDRLQDRTKAGRGGYRFGDLTRGALKRLEGRVTSLNGKESYRFGDLTLWLDSQAKEHVGRLTNRTGTSSYRFGDISRELVRRLREGEYNQDDLMLFLKIAITVGINVTPVARILPVRVLLDLLNLTLEASIAQSVGEKIVSTITNEIDARMKQMVTGDRNYQVGDLSKRVVAKWAGKEQYEFGDFTRTVLQRLRGQTSATSFVGDTDMDDSKRTDSFNGRSPRTAETILNLNERETEQLEAWDRQFLAVQRAKDGLEGLADDERFRDWDEMYLSSSPSSLPGAEGPSATSV